MNPSQIESYNNVSIDELLQSELNNPDPRTWVLVLAKARIQQCTQNSLTMTLMLLERDGDKWLEVLKRFSFLEFKLVFSFCIRKMKTYGALMESVYKLGEPEHQRMMQQKIENAMQGQFIDPTMNANQLWTLYLSYLSQCTSKTPRRTLFALQKIERRLGNMNNIYEQLVDLQKAHFIEVLCRILKFHEDEFLKKLELRKFWESIGNTIKFLRLTMNTDGLMTRLLVKLKSFSIQEQEWVNNERGRMQRYRIRRREESQVEKQRVILMITRACQVLILQDLFIYHAQRLAIQLLQVPLIDYQNYQSSQELQQLQTSLIYHIHPDDIPSLLSQLLVSLGQNIPNFMNTFVSECMFFLTKQTQHETTTSDIILKLCILSKLIIEQSEYNGWDISIKELIDKLVVLSDSRSQVIQVKTLLLMHYFKQILPQSYFLQYHQAIFRILKHFITQQINNNNIVQHTILQMNQSSINKSQSQIFSGYKHFQYTRISYTECVKILEEETQRKEQESGNMEMKIRKKKFINQRYVNDLFRNHVLSIADKLIHLVTIQGYCQQQSKLLTILRNLLEKYPIVQQRNTVYLIKVLSKQFMCEYDRLSQVVNIRNKNYSKILLLLQCLQLVWGQVSEQSYIDCEQCMLPVIGLLKQQQAVDFEEDIIRLLSIMILKAKIITPQLNNFIIYTKRVLNNSQSSLLSIESVLKQMCKLCIVRSVREEWQGLILYITGMFNQYLVYVMENRTIELYYKDWLGGVHVIQLFLQSYQEEYEHQTLLSQSLLTMQSIILQFGVQNEQTHQLLMTIHHIIGTTKHKSSINLTTTTMMMDSNNNNQDIFSNINTLQQFAQLNLYQQHYSIHLLQLTLLDVLNLNLRNGNFNFSYPNNPLYQFIDLYKYLQMHIQDSINSKSSSPNDLLPFSKINLNQYASVMLDSLHKQKLIDIQQFTQLKSILLPHHYLVSNTLFQ